MVMQKDIINIGADRKSSAPRKPLPRCCRRVGRASSRGPPESLGLHHCRWSTRPTGRVGRASSRGLPESLDVHACRSATRPATPATFPARADQPHHRHRARTHNPPVARAAPRRGPRRSHRPRRDQTHVRRNRWQSPVSGLWIPCQRPRFHRTDRPRIISIWKYYFLHPSR